MTEEERQKQRLDVRAVNVGIRHYDYLAVAKLVYVELVAYSAAESHDYRRQRLIAVYLVRSRLFDVEYLSSKRKYRLEAAVTTLFCRTACGISLDEEKLCVVTVSVVAVGKLSGERTRFERRLGGVCSHVPFSQPPSLSTQEATFQVSPCPQPDALRGKP